MNSDKHDSNIRTAIVPPYCCNGNYDSRRRGEGQPRPWPQSGRGSREQLATCGDLRRALGAATQGSDSLGLGCRIEGLGSVEFWSPKPGACMRL